MEKIKWLMLSILLIISKYGLFASHVTVDGGWSPWHSWSKCSQACGIWGIARRIRICNQPVPKNNGSLCLLNVWLWPVDTRDWYEIEQRDCNDGKCFVECQDPFNNVIRKVDSSSTSITITWEEYWWWGKLQINTVPKRERLVNVTFTKSYYVHVKDLNNLKVSYYHVNRNRYTATSLRPCHAYQFQIECIPEINRIRPVLFDGIMFRTLCTLVPSPSGSHRHSYKEIKEALTISVSVGGIVLLAAVMLLLYVGKIRAKGVFGILGIKKHRRRDALGDFNQSFATEELPHTPVVEPYTPAVEPTNVAAVPSHVQDTPRDEKYLSSKGLESNQNGGNPSQCIFKQYVNRSHDNCLPRQHPTNQNRQHRGVSCHHIRVRLQPIEDAPQPNPDDVIPKPDHVDVISEPDQDDIVSEPGHADVTSEPDHDDIVSEPDHVGVISKPDHNDVIQEPDQDDIVSEPDHADVISEPDHDDVISEPDYIKVTIE